MRAILSKPLLSGEIRPFPQEDSSRSDTVENSPRAKRGNWECLYAIRSESNSQELKVVRL